MSVGCWQSRTACNPVFAYPSAKAMHCPCHHACDWWGQILRNNWRREASQRRPRSQRGLAGWRVTIADKKTTMTGTVMGAQRPRPAHNGLGMARIADQVTLGLPVWAAMCSISCRRRLSGWVCHLRQLQVGRSGGQPDFALCSRFRGLTLASQWAPSFFQKATVLAAFKDETHAGAGRDRFDVAH